MKFLALLLLLFLPLARAEIPEVFAPLVVTPPFSFTERLIDLTAAFEKAKLLNKPMLVYLGAADCPPCQEYSAFLEKNKEELKAPLADVVLVDIRTWLQGPKLIFQIDDKKFTAKEFMLYVRDTHQRLVYPSWWLLTPQGKQVRQLPQGAGNFTSVENHIKLLKGS
jgi:thiol-disulfide isomerase/thioredoxin